MQHLIKCVVVLPTVDRKEQYLRKISFIEERLNSIPEFKDDIHIDAALYRIQTAIEAAMDLIAMMVKDSGESVSDDYSNIEKLAKLEILNEDLGRRLIELNGLRNWIVHRYNKLEVEIIKRKKDFIVETLMEFLEVVWDFIKRAFGEG